MINPNKYIVLKRADLSPRVLDRVEIDALEDAVVIRKRDIFAEAGLNAYASSVQTVIEILRTNEFIVGDDTIEHLQDIADYFHGEAAESRQLNNRHIPD